MKKNKISITLLILSFIMILIGGTFAYARWQTSSSETTNVAFTVEKNFSCSADGGGNILQGSIKLAPTTCTDSNYAIKREIKINTNHEDNKPVYLNMWLNVNSIDTELSESANLKYVLTTSNTSCQSGTIIADGSFQGSNAGSKISLFDGRVYTSNAVNDKYYLYIWLDEAEENINTMGKTFDVSLGGMCTDKELSQPNAPVIKSGNTDTGLIPVIITDSGTVIATSKNNPNWYNYDGKKWANAVLVNSTNRNTYLGIANSNDSSSTMTMDISDILAYFVWIPRYSYKIWKINDAAANPANKEIEIKFVGVNAPVENGSGINEWLTHPAFTFGNENLPGIWVGKFELSYNKNGTTYASEDIKCSDYPNNSSNVTLCENNSDLLRIIPYSTSTSNVQALRDNTVSSFFYGIRNMQRTSNAYGLPTDDSIVDAHMLKNNEWGAVAYLSHSIYGINDEVRINNNTGYKPGCGAEEANGASNAECQIRYGSNRQDLTIKYPQSTTGNISGVFDMSGGSWEYVMGNYTDNGTPVVGSSGFSTYPDSKYYQTYTTIGACAVTANDVNGNCLGDALNETRSWYGDYANFVSSGNPWFLRGGHCGAGAYAGAFYFNNDTGTARDSYSSRAALVVR